MDFAIFAIAFNIGKMYNKSQDKSKKREKSFVFAKNHFVLIFVLYLTPMKTSDGKFYSNEGKMAA
jgi:hypothetical protein